MHKIKPVEKQFTEEQAQIVLREPKITEPRIQKSPEMLEQRSEGSSVLMMRRKSSLMAAGRKRRGAVRIKLFDINEMPIFGDT